MGWAEGLQWFGWVLLMAGLAVGTVTALRRRPALVREPAAQTLLAGAFGTGLGLSLVGGVVSGDLAAVGRFGSALVALGVLVVVSRRSHERARVVADAATGDGQADPRV